MGDNLTPSDRQKTMRAVKSKGSRLERRLWAILAGMRLSGWKKNAAGIVGHPDVAFVEHRLAIFVDGCFWHGCPRCRRKLPKTNRLYWKRKIERNIALAKSCNRQLRRDGWVVLRIWEHEADNAEKIKSRIIAALQSKESRREHRNPKRKPSDTRPMA